jgi:hypothetical protein
VEDDVIRVKCSLCGGCGKDGSCIRCYDGTESIEEWHASRGIKIPAIKELDSGYFRLSFDGEIFAQFPKHFKGILPREYIFNPAWNAGAFQSFEIV